MTAPSQTRIVNKALALLGSVQRIAAIGDGTAPARTAIALWDDARDATLADHPWNFAIARAALAADVARPAFGYAFRFALPADCLRWLPPARDGGWFAGEQEGRFLLTDATGPLNIRYVARVEDVGLWSIGFADALAWRLAAEMAEPITAQAGVAQRMMQGYADALTRAKRQDGLATGDRAQRVESRSDWLGDRERSGSSWWSRIG